MLHIAVVHYYYKVVYISYFMPLFNSELDCFPFKAITNNALVFCVHAQAFLLEIYVHITGLIYTKT